MINGACGMLEAAKQLAVHPKDPAIYQIYSYHSKNISDAIKSLVSSIKYVLLHNLTTFSMYQNVY